VPRGEVATHLTGTRQLVLLLLMKQSPMLLVVASLLAGCGADYHAEKVRDDRTDRVTLGTAQRNLSKGMSGAQVLDAMGSPNVVSTDELGREVWVYDKFATEVRASSSVGWWIVGSGSSGAASRTQRTLTVIVKFDENKQVRDIAYHQSSF